MTSDMARVICIGTWRGCKDDLEPCKKELLEKRIVGKNLSGINCA